MQIPEQIRASARIKQWREQPHVFVRDLFGVEPDAWQDEALQAFPHTPRLALKACTGPGKTALLSWLSWNFLLTRPYPRIGATAISSDNLRNNLWSEMAKWQGRDKLGILRECFTWQAERIYSKEHPETWWMSARNWSRSADQETQGNTLRGLHADYAMVVLDESGGIPDAVAATIEGIGTSATEWHIVQAGNPTHLTGPLYRACTRERRLWKIIDITADPDNPRRSSRVSIQWAREQIEKYGRDNPWVVVNVFGEFPPSSLNSLLGPDDVTAAIARRPERGSFEYAPKVLGVDVARFGDDPSVIQMRQGLNASMKPRVLRNQTAIMGAGEVSRMWNDLGADSCMIDATGGFGAGWVDCLRDLGYRPLEVQFAGEPRDKKYYNKRAEMWFDMAQWVKAGGALPDVPDLVAELTEPTYTFKGDRLIIEPKEQVKERIGRSTDHADALACTFAFDVPTNEMRALRRRGVQQYALS